MFKFQRQLRRSTTYIYIHIYATSLGHIEVTRAPPIVRCVSSPVQTHAKSYHVLLRYLNNIRKLKSAQTISFRSTLKRSFLDSFPFLLSNLIQVYAHQLEISCVSAPLLIDGRVVGNADINRRVVIRAYAPCLAWKTIFHAGDNSCRLVCLTLARSLALSLSLSLSLSIPLLFPSPFSPFTAFVLCSQWSLVLFICARYQAGRRRQRSSDNRCLPYGESESLNEEDESLEFSSNFSFFFYPEENFSKFGIFEFSSQKNWADIVSRSVSVSVVNPPLPLT